MLKDTYMHNFKQKESFFVLLLINDIIWKKIPIFMIKTAHLLPGRWQRFIIYNQ